VRYNCGVAIDAPDDTELERLLTQLLRLVRQPVAAGAAAGGIEVASALAAEEVGAAEGSAVADGTAVTDGSAVPEAAGGEPDAPTGAAAAASAAGAAADQLAPGRSTDIPVNGAAARAGIPGLSESEARALIELVSARGIAQGELAGLLGLEKSTVSRLAAGLERKGWIRRGRDEGNQRYVRLYLTPEGGAIAARVWHAWHSRQARILAALSDEERAGLSAGLRGLVRGLAAEGLLDDPATGPPD
jgi:DNA-binding MarR family transcriptional regulator